VVATAGGGVPGAMDDAGLLVAPDDADAAASALARLAAAPELRSRLSEAGLARVRERTLEAESSRVAAFLSEAAKSRPAG
jgi:glycosyltransferase involved in cell wall biosynthesis